MIKLISLTEKISQPFSDLERKHIPLNKHLNRIGVIAEKTCPLCNHPEENVEHHLFNCPKLAELNCELNSRPRCLTNTILSLCVNTFNSKTHAHTTSCHWVEGRKTTNCWLDKKKKKKHICQNVCHISHRDGRNRDGRFFWSWISLKWWVWGHILKIKS